MAAPDDRCYAGAMNSAALRMHACLSSHLGIGEDPAAVILMYAEMLFDDWSVPTCLGEKKWSIRVKQDSHWSWLAIDFSALQDDDIGQPAPTRTDGTGT